MRNNFAIISTLLFLLIFGGTALAEGGDIATGDDVEATLEAGAEDTWTFVATAGERVDISVHSEEFDTFLEILDSEEIVLDSNDDGPDGPDSFIQAFTFPEDGIYHIVVSGYDDQVDHGQYNLKVDPSFGGKILMGNILPGEFIFANLEAGYWHGWEFDISEETYVTFSLQSDDFDAFLEVYGPDGFLDSDDDGMGGTNAIISDYLIEVPGTYMIYASGYRSEASGDYVLEYSIDGEEVINVPPVSIEKGIDGLLEEAAIEYSTMIFEDGSGTFGVNFAINNRDAEDLVEQMEELDIGDGVDDWCDEVEDFFDDIDGFPKLDDTAYHEEGDEVYSCGMIFEFDNFDELVEIYEAFGFIDVQDLDMDGEGNIDYALEMEQVGRFVQILLSEDADARFLWSVSVPGKLGENNADDVLGKHAVWEIGLDDTTEIELAAEKGGISLIFLIILAGILVLLVGGGLGIFFLIKALSSK